MKKLLIWNVCLIFAWSPTSDGFGEDKFNMIPLSSVGREVSAFDLFRERQSSTHGLLRLHLYWTGK